MQRVSEEATAFTPKHATPLQQHSMPPYPSNGRVSNQNRFGPFAATESSKPLLYKPTDVTLTTNPGNGLFINMSSMPPS